LIVANTLNPSLLQIATAVSALPAPGLGSDHITFYQRDADGRQTASISGLGEVSQVRYNADGTVYETVQYLTRATSIPDPAQSGATLLSQINAAVSGLPPMNLSSDRIRFFAYDADGRQIYRVTGLGEVSQSVYNADGTVAESIQYLSTISATALAGQI